MTDIDMTSVLKPARQTPAAAPDVYGASTSRRTLLKSVACLALVPTAEARAIARVAAAPAAISGAISPADLDASLARAVAQGTPGLSAAIATRRGVIWTGVAGYADLTTHTAIDEATLFGIGSITKMFVAVVVLQLAAEGRLDLDATVEALLGRAVVAGIANANLATVGQLLAHRGGVPSWEDDPTWIRHGRGAAIDVTHHWAKGEPLDYIRGPGHPALGQPGGAFHYSNSGFTLLGLIVEKITGRTAEEEIRHRILTPLALRDSYIEGFETGQPERLPHRYHYATADFRRDAGVAAAFPPVRPNLIDVSASRLSVEWTAGGMISSPRDLVLFAAALRDGRLLDKTSLDYMKQWAPARSYAEMGHSLFRFATSSGALLGHAGSVLGFTGGLGWTEEGDAVIAVLANVGAMHSGETPPAAYDVLFNSDFTALALRYAMQQGRTETTQPTQ